jgi:lactoylglutathione lyase
MARLARFYEVLGLSFTKHRHGKGPEHLSSESEGIVFEIYPAVANESTAAVRLGFSVPSLEDVLARLKAFEATVLAEPADTPFGRRAVVKDSEGHKVELYEKAATANERALEGTDNLNPLS